MSDKPASLSPYDVLKTIALLLMLCDHVGAYFLHDQHIWRVLGRLCVPIWLFLIGYARSRRIDMPLAGAAVFLVLLHFAVLQRFYGLNILFAIILIRLTIDPLMRFVGSSETRLYGITFILFMVAPFTRTFMEYGTIAWVLAMWGYLVRHQPLAGKHATTLYGLVALSLYMTAEMMMFGFPLWAAIILGSGALLLHPALTRYLPDGTHTGHTMPAFFRSAIAFTGRHTLFLYVLHLVVILGILAVQSLL